MEIKEVFKKLRMDAPPIIMYNQLKRLMECIVLYPGKESGHWISIIEHPDSWEIFDSTGLEPDEPIDFPGMTKVPKKFHDLVKLTNKRVDYNEVHLQKFNTSTCGLWCINRFIHKKYSCKQFEDMMKDITDKEICRIFNMPDLLK